MKCDICFTPIPVGSYECPKCGYKYRKTTTIKSSTFDFDHIETDTKMPTFDHIKLGKQNNEETIPSLYSTLRRTNPRKTQTRKANQRNSAKGNIGVIIWLIIIFVYFYFMFFIG